MGKNWNGKRNKWQRSQTSVLQRSTHFAHPPTLALMERGLGATEHSQAFRFSCTLSSHCLEHFHVVPLAMRQGRHARHRLRAGAAGGPERALRAHAALEGGTGLWNRTVNFEGFSPNIQIGEF